MIFIKINIFLSKVGPIWAHKGLFTQVFFQGSCNISFKKKTTKSGVTSPGHVLRGFEPVCQIWDEIGPHPSVGRHFAWILHHSTQICPKNAL